MTFINQFIEKNRIQKKLITIISQNFDLKKKGLSSAKKLTKADLDSVELMLLFQKIETEFGKQNLIEFYKVQNLNDIVEMIYSKKN